MASKRRGQTQQPRDPSRAVEVDRLTGGESQQASGGSDVVEVVRPDLLVARAAAQHGGAISYDELRGSGLGPDAIQHRAKRGVLHRLHRGIYLVGHTAPAAFAAQHAAVLAFGTDAYLYGGSALEAYDVLEPVPGPIHVLVLNACRRSRPGVRVHRTTRIAPEDIGHLNGLRITSPARAILDYAETATPVEVSRAINEAHVRELATPDDLLSLLARTPGRRGARKVTQALARHDGARRLHQGLEQIAYRLIQPTPIPNPETNAEIHGVEVDLLWRDEGLVVELDSGRFHGTPAAVDRDRRKEAHLRAHRCEVLRYSYWQIKEEPHFVIAEIAATLERRRSQTRA
jgi:predicted transcriptional regulator of viral defense system